MTALVPLVVLFGIAPVAASGAPLGTSARVIHYVSLGDSVTSVRPSFVDTVAKGAGVTLHGRAVVTRIVEEDAVAYLVARIKSTPKFKDAIRSADLITITLGANQIGAAADEMTLRQQRRIGLRESSRSRLRNVLRGLACRVDATSSCLEDGYRLLTSYNTPGVFSAAKGAAFTSALRAENHFVCAQALRRRMKCVDVFAAFNGANGSGDPHATGLTVSDGHPSAKGSVTIARVVLATGFAPLH